jgi:hypothetical protein
MPDNIFQHHDGIIKLQRTELPAIDVRSHVMARYPEESTPRHDVFFRPSALQVFLRFADIPDPHEKDRGISATKETLIRAWAGTWKSTAQEDPIQTGPTGAFP